MPKEKTAPVPLAHTMKLGIKERFVLLGILPQEGNIMDIRVVRDLKGALSFSEEEHKAFGFQMRGEGATQTVTWDEKKAKAKDIPIGPRAHTIIQDALKKLNDGDKLTADHINLYELFFPEERG